MEALAIMNRLGSDTSANLRQSSSEYTCSIYYTVCSLSLYNYPCILSFFYVCVSLLSTFSPYILYLLVSGENDGEYKSEEI